MVTNIEYEVDERDIEYPHQAGKAWLARIYQPKGTGPFPSTVDVHGGRSRKANGLNNADIDRALAAKGILVAAVDFRQPEAGYPASIGDVNLAVRWLKAHAAEFNGTTAVRFLKNRLAGN
jgi:acetyl esterase